MIFDSDFSFHKHVSEICKSCFYHIRDLRRILRHIPLSTAKTISNALICSRLDYCNSLLNNIAKQDLSKLQRVQNCLARVVPRGPRFSPSLPLLKQLHWLPVNYRIQFKLSTLTYRALAIHQPPYIASLLHFSNIPRQLRSSQQLSIPRTKLNLGKRAFSVAAPIIWNELPTILKYCESLASFREFDNIWSRMIYLTPSRVPTALPTAAKQPSSAFKTTYLCHSTIGSLLYWYYLT